MTTRTRSLACWLLVGSCLGGGLAARAENEQCLSPEVAKSPDLSKLPNGSDFQNKLRTPYGTARLQEVSYSFTPDEDLVRVRELFSIDFSDIVSGIRSEGFTQAKARENCNTSINPKNFELKPAADGSLAGGFDLDTTFRGCQIFDVPCTGDHWWEITTCRVTWKEDLDSHTFGVNIRIRPVFFTDQEKVAARAEASEQLKPQLASIEAIADPVARDTARYQWQQDVEEASGKVICSKPSVTERPRNSVPADGVQFCGTSRFDERGYSIHDPVKNFFLNLIGIATLNIGSKFILDTYKGAMSDVRTAINQAFSANLPGRSDLIGQGGPESNALKYMHINQSDTGFRDKQLPDGSSFPAFDHVTEHPSGQGVRIKIFCKIVRPHFSQYGALLRSTTSGDKRQEIPPGGSLWNIAKEHYGSGMYFLTLLPANEIEFAKASTVRPGTVIEVPAMYKIFSGASRRVMINESLWRIAAKDLGDGKRFQEISQRNRRFLESTDRIYPVQLLGLK